MFFKQTTDDTIVEMLLHLSAIDGSEPRPGNNDAWTTDLVVRRLEADLIRSTPCAPQRFAGICHMAEEGCADESTRLLFKLGRINGLRRLESCDTQLVRRLLESSMSEVEALAESARKTRLLGLVDYHTDIFARSQGEYDLGAQAQERACARAKATGDTETAAIAELCARVAWVNHALKTGEDPSKLLDKLLNSAIVTSEAVSTEGSNRHWPLANLPIHLLFAHIWARQTYGGAAVDKHIVLSISLPGFDAWIDLVKAISELEKGERAPIERLTGDATPEVAATAFLLLARHDRENSRLPDACQAYLSATAYANKGAAQIAAIAARELAELEVSG